MRSLSLGACPRFLSVAFAVLFFFAFDGALAQELDRQPWLSEIEQADQTLRSLAEQTRVDSAREEAGIHPMTPCAAGTVSCGSTRTGRVSVDSCETAGGVYGVAYQFSGTAGQRVTIRASSPSFRMVLGLTDGRTGNTTVYADDQAPSNGANAEISNFALPFTGPYLVVLTPGTAFTFGDYTLNLTCQSTPPPPPPGSCTENSTTLCLSGGRFKVQTTWRTNDGQTGEGKAVKLTADTGYFWFFSQENVEMVIKVLNACAISNRIWVFSGGLTNVRVETTVTDTKNGTFKQYTNPLNTAFQPVQDTSAFATCP